MTPKEMRALLDQEYLTPSQVARIFGVAYNTVIHRIQDGKLPAERVGNYLLTNKRYRISSKVVREILEKEMGVKFVDNEPVQWIIP